MLAMTTKWKIVAGFDDYAVSTDGAVSRRGAVLKTSVTNGYKRVVLCGRDGARRRELVHRLVLEAFVGPCPDGMEACHANGVRGDNRLANLRWDTRKNNFADRDRHGTTARGAAHGMAKLTAVQVRAIRRKRRQGEGLQKLADEYGVHHSTISNIASRRIWSHI